MIKHEQHGFTIVELLIVIVVISVLAAITVTAFNGVQQRAQDSQILSAANQIEKAYQSSIINGKPAYLGGYMSSYDQPSNRCNGGYGGWVDDMTYSYNPSFCTLTTVLVADKSIPVSLVRDLPKTNTVQTNYTSGNRTMMVNQCGSGRIALTYALNKPRPDQRASIESACNSGNPWDPFTAYGMNAGNLITAAQ